MEEKEDDLGKKEKVRYRSRTRQSLPTNFDQLSVEQQEEWVQSTLNDLVRNGFDGYPESINKPVQVELRKGEGSKRIQVLSPAVFGRVDVQTVIGNKPIIAPVIPGLSQLTNDSDEMDEDDVLLPINQSADLEDRLKKVGITNPTVIQFVVQTGERFTPTNLDHTSTKFSDIKPIEYLFTPEILSIEEVNDLNAQHDLDLANYQDQEYLRDELYHKQDKLTDTPATRLIKTEAEISQEVDQLISQCH